MIFAMANPVPEIMPDSKKLVRKLSVLDARISQPDNNVLAFPHSEELWMYVRDINDEMKIAAAEALAGLISDDELNPITLSLCL